MQLIIGNPLGWWAFAGVLALVAIHMLQRRSRRVSVSTLFLVEKVRQQRQSGRRFRFWRSSWSFLLQLAALLLLIWLLLEPRWLREDARQKVAIVLDSSYSMTAFVDDVFVILGGELPNIGKSAAETEWILIDSFEGLTLYRGNNRNELMAELKRWRPRGGMHDHTVAITQARLAVGRHGRVIYVSDHIDPLLLEDAEQCAVGHAFDNAGFTGVQVFEGEEGWRWKVLLRNYSDAPVVRDWWFQAGDAKSSSSQVNLEPRQIITLSGYFPKEETRLLLRLTEDEFTMDDSLPLVIPYQRNIRMNSAGDENFREWYTRETNRKPT